MVIDSNPCLNQKTQRNQVPNPNTQKYLGFKKKYEKIYSLKYLNINKIFLKPKNFTRDTRVFLFLCATRESKKL
jgi:hypothetical protein